MFRSVPLPSLVGERSLSSLSGTSLSRLSHSRDELLMKRTAESLSLLLMTNQRTHPGTEAAATLAESDSSSSASQVARRQVATVTAGLRRPRPASLSPSACLHPLHRGSNTLWAPFASQLKLTSSQGFYSHLQACSPRFMSTCRKLYRRYPIGTSSGGAIHTSSLPMGSDDPAKLTAVEFLKPDETPVEAKPVGDKQIEEVMFEMFRDETGKLHVGSFLSELGKAGIRMTDIRLKEMMNKLQEIQHEQGRGSVHGLVLDEKQFHSVIKANIVLISRAIRRQFVIPEFQDFTKSIDEFYWKAKVNMGGTVADYIPQLAKYNPDYWGVSICTVDGQRYCVGDTEIPFTIQSSGKPINYAIALSELGADEVHKFIGQEPSGRMFNELVLDHNKQPHNPMVNAGAIVVCSLLLNLIEPKMRISEKFDWVCNYFKSMAGGEYLGFSNATFLSEKEAADRNYAIAYFMRENKCFPEKSQLKDVMDFYFQLCSLEVNCHTVAVMASTLANGGICPATGEQVISPSAVRDVLSLMHSCGMYDYSGQFAFKVGLPAKSGVAGCTMVVVPNVMGFCCWSPPLDHYGNSVRGVEFCESLTSVFNFHHYDNLRHVPHKRDPRKLKFETQGMKVVSLLFSAATGDVTAMRRHYLSGMNVNMADYDGRTALHLAAAEGQLECVKFLLNVCSADPTAMDRWQHTPLDEAKEAGHRKVIDYLERWHTLQPINSPIEY